MFKLFLQLIVSFSPAATVSGCRSTLPLPPVSLNQPGWSWTCNKDGWRMESPAEWIEGVFSE